MPRVDRCDRCYRVREKARAGEERIASGPLATTTTSERSRAFAEEETGARADGIPGRRATQSRLGRAS